MDTLVIIDDKDHALRQIVHALGAVQVPCFHILHFDSFNQYQACALPPPAFVFLDFFLDLDGLAGTTVVEQIACTYLVGFSSLAATTSAIRAQALAVGRWDTEHAVALVKDKSRLENPALAAWLRPHLPTGPRLAQATVEVEQHAAQLFDFKRRPELWLRTNAARLAGSNFEQYYYADAYQTWWVHRVHRIQNGTEPGI